MTFFVNGIQQSWSQQLRFSFLLQASSLAIVKAFLEHAWIIVLSISPHTQDPSFYAPSFVRFSFSHEEIVIISTLSLKELCFFVFSLNLPISEANIFPHFAPSLSSEDVTLVIQWAQMDYINFRSQQSSQVEKKKEIEKKLFTDERLIKAKSVVDWVLQKSNLVLEKYSDFLLTKELKGLKDKIEELKKQRMGTNYEKIRDLLQDVLLVLEQVQKSVLLDYKKEASFLFERTQVTDADLEEELLVLEKVKKQISFGGHVSALQKDYEAFWAGIVFLHFLKKDFFFVFRNVSFILFFLFDVLEFFILAVLSFLWVFFVSFSLFSSTVLSDNIWLQLFGFGFFGLLVFLIRKLRNQNALILLLLLILLFALFFFFFPLLKHSLALF